MFVFEFIFMCAIISASGETHNSRANFDDFPSWFTDNSVEGFYMLGWSGERTYDIFSWITLRKQDDCKIVEVSKFLWRITFEGKSHGQKCIINYGNNGQSYQFILDESDLPNPSCKDPSEVYKYIEPSSRAPGERVVYCNNGSIFEEWYEFQDPKNCYNVYLRMIFRECNNIAVHGKTDPPPCSAEISPTDIHGINKILVKTNSDGTIQLKSNTFIKVVSCNIECAVEFPVVDHLTLTCPNGDQHPFSLDEDLRHKCWLVDTPYVRWIALSVCKISFHPWLIIVLLIWSLIGHLLSSIFLNLIAWSLKQIHHRVIKKIQLADPELGTCLHCNSMIKKEEEIKDHLACKGGTCPNCKHTIQLIDFRSHVKKCTSLIASIKATEAEVKRMSKLLSFHRVMVKLSLNKLACQAFRIIGSIAVLLSIFVPPVRMLPAVTRIATPSDFALESIRSDGHNSELSTALILLSNQEHDFHNQQYHYELGLFEQMKEELTICGDSCFKPENQCKCPLLSNNSDVSQTFLITVENSITSIRRKREASSLSKLDTNSTEPELQEEIGHDTKSVDKHKHIFKFNLNSDNETNVEAHLPNVETILTNWGRLTINSQFEPAHDDENIQMSWDSFRKDRTKVYIKGMTDATLNVYRGSGLTYSLSNQDSDEIAKISTFIYDYTQNYRISLKYVTSDRKLQTWYRGSCTGGCVENCACSSNTCHYKKWDYDRSFTCNPTWCWAISSGCSCCAMDIKQKFEKWIVAVYEVEYINTEMVICQHYLYDKFNCKIISENTAMQLDEIKFTYSKVFNVDRRLPERIGVYWHMGDNLKYKLSFPSGVWLNPNICDDDCHHGSVGDFKSNNLDYITSSQMNSANVIKNKTKHVEVMTWNGVDVEHTCHFGSWPDCNFDNMVKDLGKQFEFLNETSEHLSDRFIVQRLIVNDNSQLELKVRPKESGGQIKLTMQVRNLGLKRKEEILKVSSIKQFGCEGCYACKSGFKCKFSAQLVRPKQYNIHLETLDQHVSLSHLTYKLDSMNSPKEFTLIGFTMMNISEFKVCIKEAPAICVAFKTKLSEPKQLMIKDGYHSTVINYDTSKCSGITGFIACTGTAISKAVTNAVNSIVNWFSNWLNAIKFLVGAVLLIAVFWAIFITKNLVFKKRGKVATIDPSAYFKNKGRKSK